MSRAQPVGTRIVEGVSVTRVREDYAVRIRFSLPMLYRRHSPFDRGELLEIQLAPLATASGSVLPQLREALRIPSNLPVAIDGITLTVRPGSDPVLEVRFERMTDYTVEQDRDLRSVIVRVPIEKQATAPGPAPAPVPVPVPDAPAPQSATATPDPPPPPSAGTEPAPSPADAPAADPREALLQEGRDALTAGDFERASALFTKLVSLPEGPDTPDALELLGLARERKGQRAHAKAEYERYLERYPDAPGAARVSQRLEALVTATEAPRPRRAPKAERRERRSLDFETFGSVYTGYRYDGRQLEAGLPETLGNVLYTDLHLESRLSLPNWRLRSQVSGGYAYSFTDSGDDELRVSSLFLEAENYEYGLIGSIGRRSRSDGGLLGRYDGIEAHLELGDRWNLGAVGGLPVDSSSASFEGFDRYFAGLSVGVERLFGSIDLEIFGIGQADGNRVDRAAIGAELRYFAPGRSLAAFIDYDVYYASLNTAQLVATWQPFDATYLTFFGDYRNVPTLTTRNALQGQLFGDLDGLSTIYSNDEIEGLARDRTGRAANLNLSLSQRLAENYQLALDVGAYHFSDLPESGGVAAFDGTGFEFSTSGQIIASNVITDGDVGILGLRYIDGKTADNITGTLSARYPINRSLRVTPRVIASYRLQSTAEDLLVVGPSLYMDLDWWLLRFDAEAGLDWILPQGGGASTAASAGRGLEYYFSLGIRHDF